MEHLNQCLAVGLAVYIITFFWWETLGGMIEKKAKFHILDVPFSLFLPRGITAFMAGLAYYLWVS